MDDGNEVAGNQLGGDVKVADLIWVKIRGSSWWPGQVIDEETVSEYNKPLKRSYGEVLVRLYGSYKYMYVNPHKCRSDFDMVLEQNNGCHGEIFLKAVEKEGSFMKSCRSKKQGSKSKEEISETDVSNRARIRCSPRLKMQEKKVGDAKRKSSGQDGLQKKLKRNGSSAETIKRNLAMQDELLNNAKLNESRARRLRVMRLLGLIAPSGSPLLQNGRV